MKLSVFFSPSMFIKLNNIIQSKLADNSRIFTKTQMAIKGEDLKIACNSVGLPSWSFNDGELPNNVQPIKQSIYVMKFQYSNEGKYVCHGETEDRSWTGERLRFAASTIIRVQGEVLIFYPLFSSVG